MRNASAVFIDANALVYFLDRSSVQHSEVVSTLNRLLEENVMLCTSHHVIEEVLFIVSRLGDRHDVLSAARALAAIPRLVLVEPEADTTFALKYAERYAKSKLGINDALLLQLLLDAGIGFLLSYDAAFVKGAQQAGVHNAL